MEPFKKDVKEERMMGQVVAGKNRSNGFSRALILLGLAWILVWQVHEAYAQSGQVPATLVGGAWTAHVSAVNCTVCNIQDCVSPNAEACPQGELNGTDVNSPPLSELSANASSVGFSGTAKLSIVQSGLSSGPPQLTIKYQAQTQIPPGLDSRGVSFAAARVTDARIELAEGSSETEIVVRAKGENKNPIPPLTNGQATARVSLNLNGEFIFSLVEFVGVDKPNQFDKTKSFIMRPGDVLLLSACTDARGVVETIANPGVAAIGDVTMELTITQVQLQQTQQPDLLIKRDDEPDSAFAINDVYQATPSGDQIEIQTVKVGEAATYQVKMENDSNVTTSFTFQAREGGDSGWKVSYNVGASVVDPANTSFAINLTPGSSEILTIRMTPPRNASSGNSRSTTIEVLNLGSPDPLRVLDAVRAEAVVGTGDGTGEKTPVPTETPGATPIPIPSPSPTATPPKKGKEVPLNRTSGCTDCPPSEGEPINTATGEYFIEPQVDIDLGGPLPLRFSRYYASRLVIEKLVQSSLGPNWMHNLDIRVVRTSSRGEDTATIVYERGNTITFKKPRRSTEWVLQSSPTETTDTEETIYQLKEGRRDELWFMDPNRNLVYRFEAAPRIARLMEIRDRNGNTLSLTYDKKSGNLTQVADGLGRKLTFTYNASGNLTQVSDGARNLSYSYTDGVLTGFTDAMGNTTNYIYDTTTNPAIGPLLAGIQRPLGNIHHTQTYDEQGRVFAQTDALGNSITLQYDTPAPGITTITDPLGNSRTNTQARDRVLTESTDNAGKTTMITRDDHDRPTSVTNRLDNTTSFTYHPETGSPAGITDARSNTGGIQYTPQDQAFGPVAFTVHNLARIDYPDGTSEEFTYDTKGNLIKHVEQGGDEWSYTYNSHGQVLTETNPIGGVFTNTYNDDGTLASLKDSDTGVTTFEYDQLKRMIKVINPDGTFAQSAYDLNDRLTSQIDENGNTISDGYDANGNLIDMTDSLGNVTQYLYDVMDRVVQNIDRLGKASITTYDPLGRISSLTDRNGNTIQHMHNENGWLTELIDPAGKVWKDGYDDEGQVISSTTPLGRTTHQERDGVGNITRTIDPLGNSVVSTTFDSMSRVTSRTNPLGRKIEYSHDGLGRLSSINQSGIGTAIFTRNGLGSITAITDLLGKVWSFGYTSAGRRLFNHDPLGNRWNYVYDQRGRLSGVTYPTGETWAISYDGAGNVIEHRYSDGTVLQFGYNHLNRQTSGKDIVLKYDEEENIINTQSSNVNFGATYDDGGGLHGVSYNNGSFSVTYTYDQRELLTSVQDNLTGTTVTFTYDDDRRLTGITRSNGITTTYNLDTADRLIRIQDGTIADQQYAYNAANEVTQVIQNLPLDPASLLTAQTDTITYDDASQASSPGYTYDGRGRQISSPARIFSWDGADNLIGTGDATLEYNGLGDVIRRTEDFNTTHYYYNYAVELTPIMAEQDEGTGQFLRYYVWTPGGSLLYMIDVSAGNKVHFYHFDHLGSTLFLTDNSGAVTDSYAYTPYGFLLGHSGSNSQPFTFIGRLGIRQEGTNGLYHVRARYYDSVTARFISRDPRWPNIEIGGGGLNPYLYALANPLKYIDMEGTDAKTKPIKDEIKKKIAKKIAEKIAAKTLKKAAEKAAEKKIKSGVAAELVSKEELKDKIELEIYVFAGDLINQHQQVEKKKSWVGEAVDTLNPFDVTNSGGVMDYKGVCVLVDSIEKTSKDLGKGLDDLRRAEQLYKECFPGHLTTKAVEFARAKFEELSSMLWVLEQFTPTDLCAAEKAGVKDVDELMAFAKKRGFAPGGTRAELLRQAWLAKHTKK